MSFPQRLYSTAQGLKTDWNSGVLCILFPKYVLSLPIYVVKQILSFAGGEGRVRWIHLLAVLYVWHTSRLSYKKAVLLMKAGNNVINEDNLMFSQQWQTIILFCHQKFFVMEKSDCMYYFPQWDIIPEKIM